MFFIANIYENDYNNIRLLAQCRGQLLRELYKGNMHGVGKDSTGANGRQKE